MSRSQDPTEQSQGDAVSMLQWTIQGTYFTILGLIILLSIVVIIIAGYRMLKNRYQPSNGYALLEVELEEDEHGARDSKPVDIKLNTCWCIPLVASVFIVGLSVAVISIMITSLVVEARYVCVDGTCLVSVSRQLGKDRLLYPWEESFATCEETTGKVSFSSKVLQESVWEIKSVRWEVFKGCLGGSAKPESYCQTKLGDGTFSTSLKCTDWCLIEDRSIGCKTAEVEKTKMTAIKDTVLNVMIDESIPIGQYSWKCSGITLLGDSGYYCYDSGMKFVLANSEEEARQAAISLYALPTSCNPFSFVPESESPFPYPNLEIQFVKPNTTCSGFDVNLESCEGVRFVLTSYETGYPVRPCSFGMKSYYQDGKLPLGGFDDNCTFRAGLVSHDEHCQASFSPSRTLTSKSQSYLNEIAPYLIIVAILGIVIIIITGVLGVVVLCMRC